MTVTTPEPPSVEAVYRFTRGLFQRTVRRLLVSDRFRMRLLERAQSELGPMPAPEALARALAPLRHEPRAARRGGARTLAGPRLVVNETRLRTDIELGPTMHDMAKRYLGIDLDYLGHVEHDDAAWLSVLRRRPLLIDNNDEQERAPTSSASRGRLLALMVTREGERNRRADPTHAARNEPVRRPLRVAGCNGRGAAPRVQAPA